ncbi:FixH family protein [Calditerricola satsumensis]|uniref:YtkA-like domain-containing protein n=1 Tax=Calditerricola satsumensis TaxID=373054 RepID=A0A8J3BFC8_9BACI|nr:FixH family protein [Calditerricola satsumensis]GGK04846.1 hypothetical protein GCM10007043_18650 [Calditerricola satsumensis]
MRISRILGMAVGLIGMAVLLGACQNATQPPAPSSPIAVTLTIEPQTIQPGDEVTFRLSVTQDGKPVDDAQEAKVELWREGDAQHEFLPAAHRGKGVYEARKRLDQPGRYHVMYHVTAREMHSMEETTFVVGNPAEAEAPKKEGHSHDHGSLTLDVKMDEPIVAGKKERISIVVAQGGHPLSGARVRLEYGREGAQKRAFADAHEEQPGTYVTTVAFPEPGAYRVRVHVEKEPLHDHKELAVTVR